MHGRPRLTGLLIASTLAMWTLAGCSEAVPVTIPDGATSAACASLSWPSTVADQPARNVEPTSGAVAAWGDPAIIARCGLAAVPPTTQECIRVDDVDWVVRELSDGAAFTTYGTDPAIEVLVPDAYAPEPLLLPDLTPVAGSLPSTGRSCV